MDEHSILCNDGPKNPQATITFKGIIKVEEAVLIIVKLVLRLLLLGFSL